MPREQMHLKILLPYRVFLDQPEVQQVVADSTSGSFGLLPRRLDCVVPLVPGILFYETADGVSRYVALDEGVMVKTGRDVVVSVRNAIGGADLGQLQHAAESAFRHLDEQQKNIRTVLARLESEFIRRFEELHIRRS